MDGEPRIAARVREMVRYRLGQDLISRNGDMVSEEIEQKQA